MGLQAANTVSNLTKAQIDAFYTTLNGAVPATQQSSKMLLKAVTDDIEFTNCSPEAIEVDLYICIDKQTNDNASTGIGTWVAGLPTESGTGTVGLQPLASDPWEKPTTNKLFNIRYWTKKHSFALASGAHKRVLFDFRPNRILDSHYWKQYGCIKGITFDIMVVHRGTLGDGDNTYVTTANRQTLCPAKLIWLAKRTIKGSFIQSNSRIRQMVGTRIPSGGITSLWVEEEDRDIPVDTNNPISHA